MYNSVKSECNLNNIYSVLHVHVSHKLRTVCPLHIFVYLVNQVTLPLTLCIINITLSTPSEANKV